MTKFTVIGPYEDRMTRTEYHIDEQKYIIVDRGRISIPELEDYVENLSDFITCSPEYSFSPLISKTYPVILTDWNLNSYIYLQQIRKFSVIFTDAVGYLKLKNLSPRFVEFPVYGLSRDYQRFREKSQREKKIDIVFLGNLNPGIHSRRNQILRKILLLPEKYKIVIGGGLYDDNLYPLVIASSKIVFNLSVRQEMNMRVFEALNCRSLLFLEDENIETWKYISKWREAIPYKTENVLGLLTKYVDDDTAREAIAEAGFEKIQMLSGEKLWNKILNTLKRVESESINKNDVYLKVATFRSLVNSFANFSTELTKSNINYTENLGIDIASNIKDNKILKSSVFNDLSFLFLQSAFVSKEGDGEKKKYVQKSIRYMNSAIALHPTSSLYWYNMAYLLWSAGDANDFLTVCRQFLRSSPPQEIDGFPNFFCPIIFGAYDYIKSYTDYMWIENINNVGKIRQEVYKALYTRLLIFLSNLSLQDGDLDQAENFATEALKNFPEMPHMYFLMGKIKFQKKEFGESANFYLKGYELDPFDFSKWTEIIATLISAGMRDTLNRFLTELKLMLKRVYFYSGGELTIGNSKVRIKAVQEIFQDFGIPIELNNP